MNLIHLIKYLLTLGNYKKYRRYLVVKKEEKEIYFLFKGLDSLVEKYQRDISLDEYSLFILTTYGIDYQPLLAIVKGSSVQDDIILDVLNDISNKQHAFEIAQLALDVSEGRSSMSSLVEFIGQTKGLVATHTEEFVTSDLEALHEHIQSRPGLRWRLDALNKSLGSLRKGDFGFIFARPETGKTTFLASEVSHFATQTQGPVLWFNNEEQGEKVMLRCIQADRDSTVQALFENIKENKEQFYASTKDNIKIIDNASLHKNMVQHLCKQYEPSLVIFDQIDKIKGFDGDRNDLRLGQIYIWARELAKTYCPVIGVCQSDGTGEGKKWLTMDNVADSKTAKQAEADWIVGIGKSHDQGFEYIRHLNISKNKLQGDKDSDPSYRHGKFDVLIQPLTARYKDIT
jgi:hypothetical protein